MGLSNLLPHAATVSYKTNVVLDAIVVTPETSNAVSFSRSGILSVTAVGISGSGAVTIWGNNDVGVVSESFAFTEADVALGGVEFISIAGISVTGLDTGIGTISASLETPSGQPIEFQRVRTSAWRCRRSKPEERNYLATPGILAEESFILYGVPTTVKRGDLISASEWATVLEALEDGRQVFDGSGGTHHIRLKAREV
jgi:hypothetical protein